MLKSFAMLAATMACVLQSQGQAIKPVSSDLWDIAKGAVIVDASSGTGAAMFGANGQDNSTELQYTYFADGNTNGFHHFVEWKTTAPVTIGQVRVFAAGDGEVYLNEREFAKVIIKAKSPGSSTYDLTLVDFHPTHPYQILGGNPWLIVDQTVATTTAQEFRAEFVHWQSGRGFDGPRVIELDAFAPVAPIIKPVSDDLWDVSRGTVITAGSTSSGVGQLGAFGANGQDDSSELQYAYFSDGETNTYHHYVEWKTVSPVTIDQIRVFAAGDGATFLNQREFAEVIIKAKSSASSSFDVTLVDFSPSHPYTYVGGNSSLVLDTNIAVTTAQEFRAEFVQWNAGRGFDGPRVIELDAFSSTSSPIPTNPPAAKIEPVAADLWDVTRGSVVVNSSSGFVGGDWGLLGANGQDNSTEAQYTYFTDGTNGFRHFVEWKTPLPVTLSQIRVFASGDGPTYLNEREFAQVVIKAKSAGSLTYDLTLVDSSPSHPYQFIGGNPWLIVDATVAATTAQEFRAEFVQWNAGRGYDGPRIIELDAFPPANSLPILLVQPKPASGVVGGLGIFSVAAVGESLSYQWFKDSSALLGATQQSLTISNLNLSDAGQYSVTVSNSFGHVDSQAAQLTVTIPVPTGDAAHTPLYVSTLGTGLLGNVNGPLSEARFDHPAAFVSDKAGNIYVFEAHLNGFYTPGIGGHAIRMIDTNGVVSTWAGGSEAGLVNGPKEQAKFSGLAAMVFDRQGNAFVTDRLNNLIRKISVEGVVSTLAGSTYGFANGTGADAQFRSPIGMCIDTNDNLYVADWENARIRKVTPGGEVTTFAGGEPGNKDGSLSEAQFYGPSYIAISQDGIMYVADWGNGSVRRIGTDGVVKTIATGLTYVESLSVDHEGFIYVAVPPGLHKLVKMDSEGRSVWEMGNPIGHQDGPAEIARITHFIAPWFYPNGDFLMGDDVQYIRKVTVTQVGGVAVPAIFTQPEAVQSVVGATTNLSVFAAGGHLSYQWRLDGTPIAGATSSNLVLANLVLTNAGNYSVVVANSAGTVTSVDAVLAVTSLPPIGSEQFLTNGLVAYYPLDANALDKSGKGHNGVVNGAAPTRDRFGVSGKAMQFNGTSDGIDCGNPSDFNFPQSFTLGLWTKLNGSQYNKYIIGKYNDPDPGVGGGYNHSYGLASAGPSVPYAFISGNGTSYSDLFGGPVLDDNKWHALVLTYDHDLGLRIYTDGLLSGSLTAPGFPPFVNDTPLMIGRVTSGQYFGGDIDDVRVYNRALSGDQVLALYTHDSTPDPLQPVEIVAQPQPATALVGGSASFTVSAFGGNLAYQWFKGSSAITGATQQTLLLSNVLASDAGQYSVTVSNAVGHVDSQPALLTVVTPVVPPVGVLESHSDLFEYPQNIEILASSAVYPGFSITKMFSTVVGTDSGENVMFAARKAPGFSHFVEWRTKKAVILSNIVLHASGDLSGPVMHEFSTFILKAKRSPSDEYHVVASISTAHPYGVSAANHYTLLDKDFDPQVLQYFRAEFTQRDPVTYPFGGPRVAELDGFGQIQPDTATFTSQPVGQSALTGSDVTLTTSFQSVPGTTIQWKMNGVDIPFGTNATLVLTNVQPTDAGTYTVALTSQAGTVLSDPAVLDVTTADAGGVVVFGNRVGTDVNAPVSLAGSSNKPSGAAYLAQLYVAVPPSGTLPGTNLPSGLVFQPSGGAIPFRSGNSAGYFTAPTSRTITNVAPAALAALQVRAWETGYRTYEDAVSAGAAHGTSSAFLLTTAGGPPAFPASLVGLQSFSIGEAPDSTGNQQTNYDIGEGVAFDLTLPYQAANASFRWSKNGVDVAGETNATLHLSGAPGDAGTYLLEISNDFGSFTSLPFVVTIQEADHIAPVIAVTLPTAGTTDDERATVSGTITDNVGVASASLELNGILSGSLALDAQGHFSLSGLVLKPGTNLFRIVALDARTNQAVTEVLVNWAVPRVLAFANQGLIQEGGQLDIPLTLTTDGKVAAITATINYDAAALADASFVWSDSLSGAFKELNTAIPGEVRMVFALAGTPLPSGVTTVGHFVARARSLASETTSALGLKLLSVYDASGSPITYGNLAYDGSIVIKTRKLVGDNNANDRLDVGDASTILGFVAFPSIAKPWDIVANDLNTNSAVDPGDAIKVLRAVVGLDPQPALPASAGSGRVHALSSSQTTGGVIGPIEIPSLMLSTAGSVLAAGQKVTVQVNLEAFSFDTYSGASFRLSYPSDILRLANASANAAGTRVPLGSAVIWNLSPAGNDYANQDGHISFAAASASAWPTTGLGSVAEFTFDVTDTVNSAYAIAVSLDRSEITKVNGQIATSSPQTVTFHHQAAQQATVEPSTVSADGKSFSVKINGQIGGTYRIEVSYDLHDWTPIQTVDSRGGVVTVNDGTTENSTVRFYRAVLVN